MANTKTPRAPRVAVEPGTIAPERETKRAELTPYIGKHLEITLELGSGQTRVRYKGEVEGVTARALVMRVPPSPGALSPQQKRTLYAPLSFIARYEEVF